MAEPTTAALGADINAGYEAYMAELRQAGPHWETKPAAGEGEDAWCARQVAEHIAGSAGLFAHVVAKAASLDSPGRTGGEFATADEAIAATPVALGKLTSVMAQVPQTKLTEENEFGPLGKSTIANVLGIVAHHFHDHAGQLRALRG
jgi:hypothetical protein